MPIHPPPAPPSAVEKPGEPSSAPIVDMRDAFARKSPETEADRARTRAFIAGKIEMIRRDPQMTEAQKAAAIEALRASR